MMLLMMILLAEWSLRNAPSRYHHAAALRRAAANPQGPLAPGRSSAGLSDPSCCVPPDPSCSRCRSGSFRWPPAAASAGSQSHCRPERTFYRSPDGVVRRVIPVNGGDAVIVVGVNFVHHRFRDHLAPCVRPVQRGEYRCTSPRSGKSAGNCYCRSRWPSIRGQGAAPCGMGADLKP